MENCTGYEERRDLPKVYLRFFEEALAQLLEWSPTKVAHWAKRFSMDDSDSVFYHYSSIHYIANLLIPAQVVKHTPEKRFKFQAALERAIDGGDPNCEIDPEFDWVEARIRVEEHLQTVGTSLAQVKLGLQEDES